MTIHPFRLALLAFAAATPAFADEPGPGGTKAPIPVTGEQVYRFVCQGCHMPDGRGAVGAAKIPALARNPNLAAPEYPIMLIAQGRGAMPPMTDMLSPEQIAAVVGYTRTHFGNRYKDAVTAKQVKDMLDALK